MVILEFNSLKESIRLKELLLKSSDAYIYKQVRRCWKAIIMSYFYLHAEQCTGSLSVHEFGMIIVSCQGSCHLEFSKGNYHVSPNANLLEMQYLSL